MLAFGSKRWIGQRWDRDLQIRLSREIAVLRFVERAFEVVDLVADVNSAAQCAGLAIVKRREVRQAGEREIHFGYRSVSAVVLQFLHEVRREVSGVGQPQ